MEFNARLGWQLIYKHHCSTWHSPLNHGINCGRRNEQVVSQPFLFWFGFSSPPLEKFPFFSLYFPSFHLFFYLFFVFVFLFYLFPFHHLFFSSSSSFAPSSNMSCPNPYLCSLAIISTISAALGLDFPLNSPFFSSGLLHKLKNVI